MNPASASQGDRRYWRTAAASRRLLLHRHHFLLGRAHALCRLRTSTTAALRAHGCMLAGGYHRRGRCRHRRHALDSAAGLHPRARRGRLGVLSRLLRSLEYLWGHSLIDSRPALGLCLKMPARHDSALTLPGFTKVFAIALKPRGRRDSGGWSADGTCRRSGAQTRARRVHSGLEQRFVSPANVETAAQHAFALRLLRRRAWNRRRNDRVAHDFRAWLLAVALLQAEQQSRHAGHDRAGKAGSAVSRYAAAGRRAQNFLSRRENAMAGQALIPVAEGHRLAVGIRSANGEDCWKGSRDVQAFAALVAGRRNDGNVLLIATTHDLRKERIYISGLDQFAPADIDQMRAGLQRQ